MKERNLILQAAVAAAFGAVAMGANAVTIPAAGAAGGAGTISTFYIGSTTSSLATPRLVNIQLQGSEGFIGRAQPFNVRIELNAGAFSAVTVSAASTCVWSDTAGTAHSGTLTTLGGGLGNSFVLVNYAGSAGTTFGGSIASTCVVGVLAGTVVDSVAAASVKGGTTETITATFIDPTTVATIGGPASGALIAATTGALTATVTAAAPSPSVQIDLAQNGNFFTQSANVAGVNSLTMGSILIGVDTTLSAYDASGAALTGSLHLNSVMLPGVKVTLTNGGFGPFVQSSGSGAVLVGSAASVAFTTGSATTITFGASNANILPTLAGGAGNVSTTVTMNVDFVVPVGNTVAMDTVTPQAQVTFTSPAGNTMTLPAAAGNLFALTKNGWSQSFYFINPSADESQNYRSYLRVSNTSQMDGAVNVTMTLDNGTVGSGQLAAKLSAGKSQLFTATNLETAAGVAIPTTTKARITVNGVFSSGAGMAFMLNPQGILTNMSFNK